MEVWAKPVTARTLLAVGVLAAIAMASPMAVAARPLGPGTHDLSLSEAGAAANKRVRFAHVRRSRAACGQGRRTAAGPDRLPRRVAATPPTFRSTRASTASPIAKASWSSTPTAPGIRDGGC